MKILQQGSRGYYARLWQRFLRGQGYVLAVDGSFGPETDKQTRAFQKEHKLLVDGIVGNQTCGQAMLLGFPVLSPELLPGFPPRPDFPSLGLTELRALFGRFDYIANPIPGNPEHIRITDGWDVQNIVTVEIPQLAGVNGAGAGRVQWHRLAVDQLLGLWQAWEEADLLDCVVTWDGSFVPRFVRGSNKYLSFHAFGCAFDINASRNCYGAEPANPDQSGCVFELVPIAHAYGFYWGGHFPYKRDGMHFEVAKLLP